MTTKAELEREVARLKQELSDLRAKPSPETPDEAETSATPSAEAHPASEVNRLLTEIGIDADSFDTVGEQLLDELSSLQKDKPLVVLLGAFVLGLAVGRALR